MQKVRSFTDLDTWKVSHQLVLFLYKCTKGFPQEERYGLVDQLRRAAVSLTSNIAEGFSRKTQKEKQQFYRTSLSSLTEIQNQLIICRDVGYLDREQLNNAAEQSIRISKLLHGLIKSATTSSVHT